MAEKLGDLWTQAKSGSMCPLEQAKLWALREVLRKQGDNDTDYAWMSERVVAEGGGHPSRQAVRQFFLKVDEMGGAWYPGYKPDTVGRPKEMNPKKRRAIAVSMMSQKKKRNEPGYRLALHMCPKSTQNPTTGKAFSPHTIRKVLTTDCHDGDPSKPWKYRFGPHRRALTNEAMAERMAWARDLLKEGNDAAWFHRNVVWIDLCSKVIPGNPKKALDQQAAGRNKRKRLMSEGSLDIAENVGGSTVAEKQCGFGDTKVWYGVALARGVVGVTVFTDVGAFPGETQVGCGMFIDRLPGLLQKMLGDAPKPRTIFSDRGPGFYHQRVGSVLGEYSAAVTRHGFRLWAGPNAKQGPHKQPPDIADLLLHETAISWIKHRECVSSVELRTPWEETPQQFNRRLQNCVAHANANYNVSGLCREFPGRLRDLVVAKGGRLKK